MRMAMGRGLLKPLGVVVLLAIGGCAAPAPTGSGGSESAAAMSFTASFTASISSPPVASGSAVSSAAASAVPSFSSVPQQTLGTSTGIPAAPGTAGTNALPPPATVAPITSGAGIVATPLPQCNPDTLKTFEKGKLTVSVSAGAGGPWVVGRPDSGQGYEPAVARALAAQLGFPESAIVWNSTDSNRLVSGRTSGFDVALGEFPTPNGSASPVDYSTGYFSISNSVVAKAGTRAAGVSGLAALKGLRLAASGASSLAAARSRIAAARTTGYGAVPSALAALRAGSVDAVVLPTPAAVTAGASITVIGQLPDGSEQPQQFGMVLAKHSPLTSCVSAAIDQMRVTGVLKSLVAKWVPAAAKPLH